MKSKAITPSGPPSNKVGVVDGGIGKGHREAVCEPLGQSLAGVVRRSLKGGDTRVALAKTEELLQHCFQSTNSFRLGIL
jgi:hypothetical protein